MILVFTGEGHAQDAGILAVFGDGQVVLQVVDHPERREFGDRKLPALMRLNCADLDADALFSQHLPHLAARAEARVAGQLILFWSQHGQGKGLVPCPFWDHEVGHFYRIVTAPHQAIPACAKHREGVFGDRDIQPQIVNRFAQYQARLDQLNFGFRCRRLVGQRRADILNQRVSGILFDLHQRVGAVNRRREQRINDRRHGKDGGNTQHPPFRFNNGPDQATDIDFITARRRGGRRSCFFCHCYPC